jgi:hypothetical protein
MYLKCKLSGVVTQLPNFANTTFEGEHPLFHVPTESLLRLAGDWAAGRLSEEESLLLFLSLLNRTGLVKWFGNVTATPGTKIVQGCMEKLLRTVSWNHFLDLNGVAVKLPVLAINQATKSLDHLPIFLEVLEDAKKDWDNRYQRRDKVEAMKLLETKLTRLINDEQKKSGFLPTLIRWSLIAGEVPEKKRKLYETLMSLKGMEIYTASFPQLNELYYHMIEHLVHDNVRSHAVLKHIKTLMIKNQQGLYADLGIQNFTLLDDPLEGQSQAELEDSVENDNKKSVISRAPDKLPVITDFKPYNPSGKPRFMYLQAMAAWNMKQRHLEAMKVIEDRQEKYLRAEEVEAQNLALETESMEPDADIDQLILEFVDTDAQAVE